MQSIAMFIAFIRELFSRRNVLYELTKRDFKSVYLGSYLGIVWAFLLPLANVFIFWFVFQIGFRSRPVENFPYVLWYISGLIIWNFFSDSVNNGMNSVVQNAFVIKKVSFSIGILPIVKILSAFIIHLFFIGLVIVLLAIYGHNPSIYYLQIIYYLFSTFVFVLGISWITSSVVIFFRDLRQIVSIFMQFGFFLTPIFWNLKILPERYHIFMKFNPVYYIVEGYRDSFITRVWFWEHWGMSLYFWFVTTIVFALGAVVFRRLRPHFADVL
jgi:lipopolysaccharide transport system permease protein